MKRVKGEMPKPDSTHLRERTRLPKPVLLHIDSEKVKGEKGER